MSGIPLLSNISNFFRRIFVDKPQGFTYASSSMAITFDEDYKNQIGCKITLRFADAIRDGEIPDEEIEEAAHYIMVAIEQLKSHDHLMDFLTKLSKRWPIFSSLHEVENGQQKLVNNLENTFQNRAKVKPQS